MKISSSNEQIERKKTKMLTVGPKIPYLPILEKALIFLKKWAPSFYVYLTQILSKNMEKVMTKS